MNRVLRKSFLKVKTIYFFSLFTSVLIFSSTNLKAQCPVTAFANPSTIYCGNSVSLTAVADGCKPLNNNFNDGTINAGGAQPWASTNGATVQNGTGTHACVGPPAEGAYSLWMGTTVAAPRAVTTNGYDLTACAAVSATLCFDMKYGVQAGASPCEGIDLFEEGISVQYSIGGGAWVELQYYDPNGGSDPTLTSWTRYCLDIPLAALGTNTAFRWYQDQSSGAGFDAWGLDNMIINLNVPGYTFDWAHDAQAPSSSPATSNVSPTDNTTYTVTYTNGTETCSDNIAVTVIKPTASATANPTTVCVGSSVQLNAESSIQMEPPAACGVVASVACTPFSSQADEQQVGSGTTTVAYNSTDNVFGNFGTAVQTAQVLFRANELLAAGMVAGKITNLSFDIQRIETSGGTTLSNITYPNVTIRLACTNLTALTSSYNNVGAVQVYSGTNVNINQGWWTVFFNQGYNWDGVSNIVVEVCQYWVNGASSQDAAPNGTGNYYAFARYNNPGYNCFFASNTNFSDGVCAVPAFTSVQTIRPNVKFGFCRPVAVALNYTWSSNPSGFTSTIKNPTHSPAVNTTYTVSVRQAGVPAACAVTADVPITVKPSPSSTINPNPVEICTTTETYEMLNSYATTASSSCVPQTFSASPATVLADGNTTCTAATSQTFSINVGGVCTNSLATNPIQSLALQIVANGGALDGALVSGDFEVYLDPPGVNPEIKLIDNRGGASASPTFNVALKTGAATNISTDAAGGLSGDYRPETAFPTTGAVMGEWKLRIIDKCKPSGLGGASVAKLASWSIIFNVPNDIVSYSWSPATNLSTPNSASTRLTTSTAGSYTYTVTATDATGCTGQSSVLVSVTNNCTLPIDLLSFDARCEDQEARLNWEVASQINNDFFSIERSLDGKYFEKIGEIDGEGNISTYKEYNFIDNNYFLLKNIKNQIYYRLKQTDFDGVETIYDTRLLKKCNSIDNANCLITYPNPVLDHKFYISTNELKDKTIHVELRNLLGQLVFSELLSVDQKSELMIDLPKSIQAGIYVISSKTNDFKFCEQKIVIE